MFGCKCSLIKIITALILVALIMAGISVTLYASFVKAEASEAQVLTYSWYVAPDNTFLAEYSGDLIAVGEIQNVGSNVLGYVFVSGTAYNSTGQGVASAEAEAYGNYLLPGQKAPFYLDFTPEDSVTDDQSWVPTVTNVTVGVSYVNDTNTTPYTGLTIPNGAVTASDSTGTYTVVGTVQNTGNQVTGNTWVIATFYNASGTVIGMNYTDYLSSYLAPGDSASFTATPTDNTAQLSSEITNFTLLIQTQPLTTSASPSASPSSSSTLPSSSPIASPSASSGQSSTIIITAGAIVVIVVVVVSLILLRKRQKLSSPPPPPPPPPPMP